MVTGFWFPVDRTILLSIKPLVFSLEAIRFQVIAPVQNHLNVELKCKHGAHTCSSVLLQQRHLDLFQKSILTHN